MSRFNMGKLAYVLQNLEAILASLTRGLDFDILTRGYGMENGVMRSYQFSATGFLLMVNLILLVLGCLLEGSTILLIVVPIFIPTAKVLGIDLVHFGVVVVVNIMIGLLTPPYGLLLFVLASMTKQPLWSIVKEAAPFIFASLLVLLVITAFPSSILWLPRVFGYKG